MSKPTLQQLKTVEGPATFGLVNTEPRRQANSSRDGFATPTVSRMKAVLPALRSDELSGGRPRGSADAVDQDFMPEQFRPAFEPLP
jgi:hypothetical protein